MRKSKWAIIIMTIVLAIATIFISVVLIVKQYRTPLLTKEELIKKMETLYNGKVEHIKKQGEHYIIDIVREDGIYEATVDERYTHVKNLVKLSEQTINNPPEITTDQETETSTIITAKKAEEIALKRQNGKIEETEFIQTEDGGYYLIEIEQGDAEITVQIHAITGNVLSISYDD